MKKIFSLILLSIFTFSCADFSMQKMKNKFSEIMPQEEEEILPSEEFAQGSEDVPLLVGMQKIAEDSLGFDSASGSIVTSSYKHDLDEKDVRDFYLKTLPKLGWKVAANTENKISLKRDKEKLEIEFAKEDGKKVVRFFISSAL